MSSDIDLYQGGGGEIQPYTPGGDLQPFQPADYWGDQTDLLDNHAPAPSQEAQLQQVQAEVGRVIASDMAKLGHPQAWINASLRWYQQNIGRDPGHVQRRHNFNLYDQKGDGLAEAWGNHCQEIGASQEYVSNVLWLLGEAVKRLSGNAVPVQGRTPTGTSAEQIMDSLNDRDYDFVVRHNENVKAQTEAYLRAKWRDSYALNIATANAYLNNLPASHRAHFDQFEPGTWTLALNSATTIEGLFNNAVGGHNLPSGSALQTEINQIHELMRVNRKAYNKDLQIQARLRTLYELQGAR